MSDFEINDIRNISEFKSISFSNFKKTDVKKELLTSLISSKIEPACYWSAELICSGHYSDLWEIIIHFYTKYIHLGNPKIAIYLEMRINNFKEIIRNGYVNNELRMRNNIKIRKLFCEIMCILCDAKRRHSFDKIKIVKEDFDMTQLKDKLKAPNTSYAEEVFMKDDAKELFMPINELSYSLSNDGKNIMKACFWVEWIMEFDSICKNKKEKILCERRSMIPVDNKYQMESIWIIWDLFLNESKKHSTIIQKIINSLLTLFTLKYTTTSNKKRKYILFFVISLLCENPNLEDEIVRDSQKELISNIIRKIDHVYKQVKMNEVSPGTDYLFKDVKATNLEKTIEKLEKLNSFENSFIPRME